MSPGRRLAAGGVVAVALVVSAATATGADPPTRPEPAVVETSPGGRLVLTSDLDGVTVLTPGDTVGWEVGLRSALPEPVPIDLLVEAVGPLVDDPDGLVVGVRSCPQPWDGDGCAAGAEVLLAPQRWAGIPDGDAALGPVDGSPRWMLVTVALPDRATASSTGGRAATIELSASASGTSAPDRPTGRMGRLPRTGARVVGPLLLAAGAVTAGVVLARIGRPRPRHTVQVVDS